MNISVILGYHSVFTTEDLSKVFLRHQEMLGFKTVIFSHKIINKYGTASFFKQVIPELRKRLVTRKSALRYC